MDDEKEIYEPECQIAKLIGDTNDPENELYDYYCNCLVYGYCRTEFTVEIADVTRLIYLWFHFQTINVVICFEGRYFPIMISIKDPVQDLKMEVAKHEAYPPEQMSLYINSIGKPLRDDLKLYEYNLHSNDCVLVRIRLRDNRNQFQNL